MDGRDAWFIVMVEAERSEPAVEKKEGSLESDLGTFRPPRFMILLNMAVV